MSKARRCDNPLCDASDRLWPLRRFSVFTASAGCTNATAAIKGAVARKNSFFCTLRSVSNSSITAHQQLGMIAAETVPPPR